MSQSQTSNGKRRPWKRFVLAAGISLGIVLLLCWKTGTKISEVAHEFRHPDAPLLVGLAFLISAAIHILAGAHKWYLILRGMGCDTTYREVLFVRMGSDPVRIVMPFKTGELSNIAYFWRRGKLSFARSASWILFDKALNIGGTFFWLIVGLVMYLLSAERAQLPQATWVLAFGTGIGIAALIAGMLPLASATVRQAMRRLADRLGPRLGGIVVQLLSTFEEIPPRRKAALLLYGIGFQLRPLIVFYLLVQAFGSRFAAVPLWAVLAWGSVVVACSNVPYTEWGTGPREAALLAVFGSYVKGESSAVLFAIGILMAVAIHFVPALFGLPLLGSFLSALGTGHAPEVLGNNASTGDNRDEVAR